MNYINDEKEINNEIDNKVDNSQNTAKNDNEKEIVNTNLFKLNMNFNQPKEPVNKFVFNKSFINSMPKSDEPNVVANETKNQIEDKVVEVVEKEEVKSINKQPKKKKMFDKIAKTKVETNIGSTKDVDVETFKDLDIEEVVDAIVEMVDEAPIETLNDEKATDSIEETSTESKNESSEETTIESSSKVESLQDMTIESNSKEETIDEIAKNADKVIYDNSKELASLHAEAKFVEETANEKVSFLKKLANAKEKVISNRIKTVEEINKIKVNSNSEIFTDDKSKLNKEIDKISEEAKIINTAYENKIKESERRIDGLTQDKDALFEIKKNELDGMVREAKERRRIELEKLKTDILVERQKMDADIQKLRNEIAEKKRIREEEVSKRNKLLEERLNELNFLHEQENFIKQATIDNAKAEEERLKLIVENQQEQALIEFEKTITQKQVEILQENLDIKKELHLLDMTNEVELEHLKKVLAEKESLSYKADSTIDTQEFETPNSVLIEIGDEHKEQIGIVIREFNKKIVKKFYDTLKPEEMIPAKIEKSLPFMMSIFDAYKSAIHGQVPIDIKTIIKLAAFITELEINEEEMLKEQTRVVCAILNKMTVKIGKGYIEWVPVPETKNMFYYAYVETPSTYRETEIYAHQNQGLWNIINDAIMLKLETGGIIQIGKGIVLQSINGVIAVLTSYTFWKAN